MEDLTLLFALAPSLVVPISISIITVAVPLVYAAVGELVVERSGVLNLGVEGMMIIGAFAGFATMHITGNGPFSVLMAAAAGAGLAAIFGGVTIYLSANQVASGLALTLLGLGLSSLWGQEFTGIGHERMPTLYFAPFSDLPLVGPILFSQDLLFYLLIVICALVWLFLFRSRSGMILRSVGENHHASFSMGLPVRMVRLFAVLFGGAMAGIGGGYLSLVHTPLWQQDMTAGRGWIALALVVFAAWRVSRVLLGSVLFGGIAYMELYLQGHGVAVSQELLKTAPYLMTIAVLVFISWRSKESSLLAPGSLGQVFRPDR